MADFHPAWLFPSMALGSGVSALPGTQWELCAAPAWAPEGIGSALWGAQRVLSTVTWPGWGAGRMGLGHMAEPVC